MIKSNIFIKVVIAIIALMAVSMAVIYFSLPGKSPFKLKTDGVLTKQADDLLKANEPAVLGAKVEAIKNIPDISELDFLSGNISAPVKMIVYYDFACPFSLQYHATIKAAIDKYGDNLVIAWRNFPLISHYEAVDAAKGFVCAAGQGKALDMIDALFAMQIDKKLTADNILLTATTLQLDIDKFKLCLADSKTLERINSDKDLAKAAGVLGTPQTYLNGLTLAGAVPKDDYIDQIGDKHLGLFTLIDKALENR